MTLAITSIAEGSFQELHSTPLMELPWHERAFTGEYVPVTERLRVNKEEEATAALTERSEPRPKRVPRIGDINWEKRDQRVLATVKFRILTESAPCKCVQCATVRRDHRPPLKYRCSLNVCRSLFSDYLSLFEHQVSVHGKIYPQCRRIRQDLFGQDRGAVPHPPITVYIGQQFFLPGYRPAEWTLQRVDQEKETLCAKIDAMSPPRFGCAYIWDAFEKAYQQVRQGGLPQLHVQYQMAMEYYASSLVHPVDTRTFQDGSGSVGNGRNWLLSPELERADYTTPFRFELTSDDESSETSDDDEEGRESSTKTTLLLETGRPMTGDVGKSEGITPSQTRDWPLWQRYLEPSDFQMLEASTLSRPPRVPRVPKKLPARVHRKRRKARKVRIPKPIVKVITPLSRRCAICQELGHKNVTCPQNKGVKHTVQCSNCGEFGHNKATCTNSPRVFKKKRVRIKPPKSTKSHTAESLRNSQ